MEFMVIEKVLMPICDMWAPLDYAIKCVHKLVFKTLTRDEDSLTW